MESLPGAKQLYIVFCDVQMQQLFFFFTTFSVFQRAPR